MMIDDDIGNDRHAGNTAAAVVRDSELRMEIQWYAAALMNE